MIRLSQRLHSLVIALPMLGITLSDATIQAADIGTAFTYQGTLENGDGPVTGDCDFEFELWNAASEGLQIGLPYSDSKTIENGLLDFTLQFGPSAIDGTARWLQIRVRCGTETLYTLLTPRIELTAVPHALALRNFRVSPAGPNFDNDSGPNIIGGFQENSVANAIVGVTLMGGGIEGGVDKPNSVEASFATVAGGVNNTASGQFAIVGSGDGNSAIGVRSVVGGGSGNDAIGDNSFVGGGTGNDATGYLSTITGGAANMALASGELSTISGGIFNVTGGFYATVPGGSENEAHGLSSLAAGHRAKAMHQGTFVWGDRTDEDFLSTDVHQFLIRASGGVGIGTNDPAQSLHIVGSVLAENPGTSPSGSALTLGSPSNDPGLIMQRGDGAGTAVQRWDFFIESNNSLEIRDSTAGSDRLVIATTGNVGIGTTAPSARLDVAGSMEVDGTTLYVDDTNDRVGIGTTSPSAKLDVVGSLEVDSTTLYVDDVGNRVGIGTSSPGEKLTVIGTIHSTSGAYRFPDNSTQTTACPVILSASVSVNPPNLGSGANTTLNVTVTGAAVGDAVLANPGDNLPASYAIQHVRVSAANTVTIGFINPSPLAIDPSSSTWEFRVIK